MNARNTLIALSMKYGGDWDRLLAAIREKEKISEEEINEALANLRSKALTIVDPEYPESLKAAFKPPLVLYYYGDVSLVAKESGCLAYIGSRDASPYGLRMAKTLGGQASGEGLTVVTGLARGIDAEATKAALEAGGKAVAVLGSGIDFPYPLSSKELYDRLKTNGLLLSEYPGTSEPKKSNFPFRNRLIAALCHALVVGEAGRNSGTLITVSYALGSNKEVGCVPYSAEEDSACNTLIKEGAFMIENLSDLNSMIGFEGEKKPLVDAAQK